MEKERKRKPTQSVSEENTESTLTPPRRLTRSVTDKVLAGVAGGLAQYLELDATLIRVIFILMAVFGGSGVLIYLILWIVMPSEQSAAQSSEDHVRENVAELRERARSIGQELRQNSSDNSGRGLWGILLLIFGIIFLAQNFGFLHNFDIGRLWPVFLIGLGLMILLRK